MMAGTFTTAATRLYFVIVMPLPLLSRDRSKWLAGVQSADGCWGAAGVFAAKAAVTGAAEAAGAAGMAVVTGAAGERGQVRRLSPSYGGCWQCRG
ncbi:MAG: hypothetical protein LBF87_03110 [Treponema sp.]|nr:hypothetical protein [Treponema sp.]